MLFRSQLVGQRELRVGQHVARECRVHRQEVARGGDVVNAEQVRALLDTPRDGGEPPPRALG